MIPKHPKVKTLQRHNEGFTSLGAYHNAHPDNGYFTKSRSTSLQKKTKQRKKNKIWSLLSAHIPKVLELIFGSKDLSVYLSSHMATHKQVSGRGPLSYNITSILRCLVTRTQTHARTYYPTNFCIISKNRVQKGSKWKRIHASILRLLQNERRLYVASVSHR